MAEAKTEPQKRLFVVSQIGEPGSEARRQADWLLKAIVRPVGEKFGYKVTRADEIDTPGLITDQVITEVLDSELVVADLTGLNPNVFYELGIRHMAEKPTIHMYILGQPIPFDIKDYRTVTYNIDDPDDIEEAKSLLERQIQEVQKPDHVISNPIIRARGRQKLAQSHDSKDAIISDLISKYEQIKVEIEYIRSRVQIVHQDSRDFDQETSVHNLTHEIPSRAKNYLYLSGANSVRIPIMPRTRQVVKSILEKADKEIDQENS